MKYYTKVGYFEKVFLSNWKIPNFTSVACWLINSRYVFWITIHLYRRALISTPWMCRGTKYRRSQRCVSLQASNTSTSSPTISNTLRPTPSPSWSSCPLWGEQETGADIIREIFVACFSQITNKMIQFYSMIAAVDRRYNLNARMQVSLKQINKLKSKVCEL